MFFESRLGGGRILLEGLRLEMSSSRRFHGVDRLLEGAKVAVVGGDTSVFKKLRKPSIVASSAFDLFC